MHSNADNDHAGVFRSLGGGLEGGLELLEEGIAGVPLLGERDLFQGSFSLSLLDERIVLPTGVVKDFAGAIGLRDHLEAVDLRESVEPMAPLEVGAFDFVRARARPI